MDNPLGTWLLNPLSFLAMPQAPQPPANPLAAQVMRNPVGAERFGDQVLTMPTPGGLDPLVYTGPAGYLTASQVAAAQGWLNQLDAATSMLAATGAASAAGREVASYASKWHNVARPPAVKPLPFEAEYPAGAPSNAAGRLTADVEGRPLTARYVVGRSVVGGDNEALPPAQLDSLSEAAFGARISPVAPREIGQDAGRFVIGRDPNTGAPDYSIFINRTLPSGAAVNAAYHEVAHGIDELAGKISVEGLTDELKPLYNTMLTGEQRTRHLTLPQHVGYRGQDIPRELMAEAIRAYMQSPDYVKTVAPKTAAAIRAAVNSNPRLARIVQFNSAAGVAVGAATSRDDNQ